MTAPHLRTGRNSENFARHWLESRGLTHVHSNFRCRFGELDLVMRDQSYLVIVEVRYRSNPGYGGALISVTPAKQQRIARAALSFLQQQRQLRNLPLRFDVLGLSGLAEAPIADWRKGAFSFDDTG